MIKIATVCGVGMGSSLILRMTVESVLKEMGAEASVTATDTSSVRSFGADVILGQPMHTSELQECAPVVAPVTNFVDKAEVRTVLEDAFARLKTAGKV